LEFPGSWSANLLTASGANLLLDLREEQRWPWRELVAGSSRSPRSKLQSQPQIPNWGFSKTEGETRERQRV
ncbi:hypothetical protein T07_10180, partial [Trichinella nelsoni]